MKSLTTTRKRFITYADLCREAGKNASKDYRRAKAKRERYLAENEYYKQNNIKAHVVIPPKPCFYQFLSRAFSSLYRECNVVAALTDDMIISNLMLELTAQHENATAGAYYNSLSNFTMD